MNVFQKLFFVLKVVQCSFVYYFGRTYTFDCGHSSKRKTIISVRGKNIVFTLQKNLSLTYCPQCVADAAIACAWCGNTIVPSDPVTLYAPRDPNFQVPEHAAVYSKDPLRLVGCLGFDCAITGADRAGFWAMPGQVERVMSPFEQVMATGDIVIVSDISDPAEAIPIREVS